MRLTKAFRKNVKSLAQAQNSYQQDVLTVNALETSVLTSNLPLLNIYPTDWNEFENAYKQAKSYALGWANSVMAQLLECPEDVQGYNDFIVDVLEDAISDVSILIDDPSNQNALDGLYENLELLSRKLGLIVSFISGTIDSVRNFDNNLPDMANQLQTIAQRAIIDAQADQEKIDKLNEDIKQLQADIAALSASIVGLSIADGAAITLGVVATIVAFPIGAVAWLFVTPIVVISTTYIVLDTMQIMADNATIQADQDQIDDLTADVASLQLLANNYSAFASQTMAIETNLENILREWQTLENDVNDAISEINDATSDASSADFNAVLTDLNDALVEWNEAYAQAGDLVLNIQVNNAVLQLGMSSSDVQETLAKGQVMDIIDYFNRAA